MRKSEDESSWVAVDGPAYESWDLLVEPKPLKRQVSDTGKALYKQALLAPVSPKLQPFSELIREEVRRHNDSIAKIVFGEEHTKTFSNGKNLVASSYSGARTLVLTVSIYILHDALVMLSSFITMPTS
jgi:hypothetical protein